MSAVGWVVLGYIGCWLHIVAASWVGERLRAARRHTAPAKAAGYTRTEVISLDDYRPGTTQPPETGRGA